MMFETFGWAHLLPLLNGMLVTIVICAITLLLGTIAGLIIGILLTSRNHFVRIICKTYVNFIRGIPLIVILFMVFFGLPMVISIDVSRQSAAIWSLTIYASAYIAEIVRGSIQSIPKGQTEAAMAIGMSRLTMMRVVILPQAFKLMIPPLVGFFIALVKDSSLVSAIGYIDLTRAGKIVGNITINPLLAFACVAVLYFAICFPLSQFSKYIEKQLQIH